MPYGKHQFSVIDNAIANMVIVNKTPIDEHIHFADKNGMVSFAGTGKMSPKECVRTTIFESGNKMYSFTLSNISYDYPNGIKGLENISLHIKAGDFVFILGESGSGKSTLLNLFTKELTPTKGEILFGQENITHMPRKQIPFYRRKLGIVKENPLLLPDKTVYDNIKIAMLAAEHLPLDMDSAILSALGMVGMRNKAMAFPEELSGGEKSKVSLARAVINNPSILIADEPTSGLDSDMSWDIMNLLDEINRRKVTVLIATHERDLVNIMRKRVVTLYNGRIIGDVQHGKYGDLI